jgi:hypothetical protein
MPIRSRVPFVVLCRTLVLVPAAVERLKPGAPSALPPDDGPTTTKGRP